MDYKAIWLVSSRRVVFVPEPYLRGRWTGISGGRGIPRGSIGSSELLMRDKAPLGLRYC